MSAQVQYPWGSNHSVSMLELLVQGSVCVQDGLTVSFDHVSKNVMLLGNDQNSQSLTLHDLFDKITLQSGKYAGKEAYIAHSTHRRVCVELIGEGKMIK